MSWFKKVTVGDIVAMELRQASHELLMAQASVESAEHALVSARSRVSILSKRVRRLNTISQDPAESSVCIGVRDDDTVNGMIGGAL